MIKERTRGIPEQGELERAATMRMTADARIWPFMLRSRRGARVQIHEPACARWRGRAQQALGFESKPRRSRRPHFARPDETARGRCDEVEWQVGDPRVDDGRTVAHRHVGPEAQHAARDSRAVQVDPDEAAGHAHLRVSAEAGRDAGQVYNHPLGRLPLQQS